MPNFAPSRTLRSPHLQTIWPTLFRKTALPARQRERFELPDGDFIDIDWCAPANATPQAPVCVLLHGLTGSSKSQYIVALQSALYLLGWRSMAVNFRGCSGIPNRLPSVYHAGHTTDIQALVKMLRQRYPQAFLAAVGYSLGGSMLANWLGRNPGTVGAAGTGDTAGPADDIGLDAACLVSVPYQLGMCSTRLDRGFSTLYRRRLLGDMGRFFQQKIDYFKALGDQQSAARLLSLGDLQQHRSFWTFDDRIMAPLHGFSSVDDYYARCSAGQYLSRISTPTLLVQAADDPFVPRAALPDVSALPAIKALISPHGGHLGFCGHRPRGATGGYWLEPTLLQWLQEQHQKNQLELAGMV
jgi:predicted alpha/beta-fold hydrolase